MKNKNLILFDLISCLNFNLGSTLCFIVKLFDNLTVKDYYKVTMLNINIRVVKFTLGNIRAIKYTPKVIKFQYN